VEEWWKSCGSLTAIYSTKRMIAGFKASPVLGAPEAPGPRPGGGPVLSPRDGVPVLGQRPIASYNPP
jgi:hypothetical protein